MKGYPERFTITSTQLRKTGEVLLLNPNDWEALDKVNKWRASHAYPLHIIFVAIKNRAKKYGKSTIVAQRLKRMPTILNKLARHKGMRLHKMQDIGGVRIVLKNLSQLNDFTKNIEIGGHKIIKVNDYIFNPKPDGYRGVHVVYEYNNQGKSAQYNGLFIELQIRTTIQHEWATAVETVGLATHKHLKLGDVDERWARFFMLTSKLFSAIETNVSEAESISRTAQEFYELEKEMKAIDFLKGVSTGIHLSENKNRRGKYRVLSIDFEKKQVEVRTYDYYSESLEYYTSQEKKIEKDSVLISVGDIKKMTAAYPNYFMDIGAFCDRVQGIKDTYEEIFTIDKSDIV